MSDIAIIEGEFDLGKAYAKALEGTGHAVKIIASDIEAMNYFVRQRKTPDVVVLDMRRPSSAEMVVMGAIYRLSHLAHTKVLLIAQNPDSGQRASQSWGADLCLSVPFSAVEFRHAIHTLTAKSDIASPTDEEAATRHTRIWWEGEEAVFIRWTDQSLILAWPDATDTAVKIPRGAVTRLMGKGVLQIEGKAPTWVRLSSPEFAGLEPLHAADNEEAALAAHPARHSKAADSGNQVHPAVVDAPQAVQERLDTSAHKLNIVTRLIRKLTSGEPQQPQGSPQVLQRS